MMSGEHVEKEREREREKKCIHTGGGKRWWSGHLGGKVEGAGVSGGGEQDVAGPEEVVPVGDEALVLLALQPLVRLVEPVHVLPRPPPPLSLLAPLCLKLTSPTRQARGQVLGRQGDTAAGCCHGNPLNDRN